MKKSGFFAGIILALTALPVFAVEPSDDRASTKWLGPVLLDPEAHGIGKTVDDIRLGRLFGGFASLHAIAGNRGTVILVRDTDCPVSRAYGPRQADMARTYQRQGFNFIVVYLDDMTGLTSLARDAGGFDGPAAFITEGSEKLAQRLGVESTGDVFVLDAQQRLRYRGAVDDQFGIGYTRDFPTRRLLDNALRDLIAGREVAVPATTAPGCQVDADPNADRPLQGWNPQDRLS